MLVTVMENKWATPSLILALVSVAVFPINQILPAVAGGLAAIFGSFGIRQNTKRARSAIAMVVGFLTFAFSGFPIGF